MRAGDVVLTTLSDLTWALQNNLAGWFGMDWTINFWFSLLKRIGDQHALREFGSGEWLSAKYAGTWGRRKGGLLSPRGRVWTFQHIVWSSSYDFDELRTAHVFRPDETDPARAVRLTLYGTALLVEPLGTLDKKTITIDPTAQNSPFLLQGGALLVDGLRGWTRAGGRAEAVYPGSLVPHFPAGGLHFDAAPDVLHDATPRYGAQLKTKLAAGATSMDLESTSSGWDGPPPKTVLTGSLKPGDRFTVEGDEQTYVIVNAASPTVNAAGDRIDQVAGVQFTPPSKKDWSQGVDVELMNPFTTPAPQDGRLTELEPDGTIIQGKIVRETLITVDKASLGVAVKDLFYLVDGQGKGQIAETVTAGDGPKSTRVRLRGDDVATLGRATVKVRGVAATPAAESAGASLTRVDDRKLGVPSPSPDYAAGDALALTLPAGKMVTAVTALQCELVLDEAPPSLASAGSVTLLDLVAGEADRPAKLGAGGLTIDFKVDANPVADLPAVDKLLLVTGKAAGAPRVPSIVVEAVDDHQVKLDRSVGAAGDDVLVRTLSKKSDVGKDPKATGAALTYTPAKAGSAPAAAAFVLVDAGKRAARRVQSVTFDGVLIDQALTAAAAPAPVNALRFPTRVSKLDGDAQPAAPIWVLTGAPKVGNTAKALAVRAFSPMPLTPAAAGANLLPAGAAAAANAVEVAPVPAPVAPLRKLTPGQLVLAATTSNRLAIVKRVQLRVTLDRALPAAASAANLELVLLDPSGPEYKASARDKLLVTVQPEVAAAAGAQTEMPRFVPGELVQITDGAVTPSYRIASVDGTTLTLEAGPDLAGPFPKAVTARRLAAADPGTGTTRAGVAGAIQGAAARSKLTFDVWSADAVAALRSVAIVDGAKAWPAAVASVDSLRIELTPEAALPDGPLTLHVPAPTKTTWSAAFTHDGDDVALEDVVIALAGAAVGPLDVVAVPYAPSPRVASGRLTPGTVKVPDRLDDQYDLDRAEALAEHELHHTMQSEELGPFLLSMVPLWAVELAAEGAGGQPRVDFDASWSTYSSVMESLTVGGVLNYAVGATWGSLLWGALCGVHGINTLLHKSGKDIDFLDPFALAYVDATPVAGQPKQVQCALPLAVGDRLRFKKPSDGQPTNFFGDMRTVTKVVGGGVFEVDSDDALPLEGGKSSVAKLPGGEGDPLRSADNALLRGYGLGWMGAILDPWGEIDFRVAPDAKSFGGVLARIARYAFGTHAWGPLLLTGVAFWDNLRRQWGLTAKGPHLAEMEQGASYFSGDTYYPLALLRASGDEAKALDAKQLYVGDVAQSWFLPTGGSRAAGSVIFPSRLGAPGVPVQRGLCQMPYVAAPAAPPTLTFASNLGWQIDPAVAQSGLAVPDVFVDKSAAQPLEPAAARIAINGTSDTERRQFLGSARAAIPVSQEMERTAGAYVAFCKPTDATHAKHRVTLIDYFSAPPGASVTAWSSGHRPVAEAESAREAFDLGVGIFSRHLVELVHDLEVLDVEARLGGRRIAEGAEVGLLPFERARLEVTPGGARRYDVTVTRPTDGAVRRIGDDLSLRAGKTAAAEPAEVTRFYAYVAGKGFTGGGLAAYGVHVPTDVHVPVRRFKVKVDTVLPVHVELDPDKVKTDALRPGEKAHLFVPVRLRPTRPAKFNPTVAVTFVPAAPGVDEPVLVADPGIVDPATVDKLKAMFAYGGRVLTVALDPDDPPEQDIQVDVSVDVGPDDANTATCTATFKVQPFFTLARVGAGAAFDVAPGATITLQCSGGIRAGAVTAKPQAGVTTTVSGGKIDVVIAATASEGKVRILVEDAADKTHKALRTITIK